MAEYADDIAWAGQQQAVMLDRVKAWASINTGTTNLKGLLTLADELESVLQDYSGQTSRLELSPAIYVDDAGESIEQPLGPAIWYRSPREDRPRVLLNIHYDTVFAPDHPFNRVHEEGSLLRGPGVVDAKGGLAIMLTAVKAFERSTLADQLAIEVLITPDEEIGSPGSTDLLHERGRACDVGLLFEPRLPDDSLAAARRGSGNYTLVVRGRSAHAGRDFSKGRNALTALAALVMELDQLNGQNPGMTVNVANIRGGGPSNVVPDLAVCRLNARVSESELQHVFEATLTELVAEANAREGISVELHGGFYAPPKQINAGIATLMDHVGTCGKLLKMPIKWKDTGGVCDGNRLADVGLAVVDTLGPSGGGLHSEDEHMVIDSLGRQAQLVTLLLLKLADGSLAVPPRGRTGHGS